MRGDMFVLIRPLLVALVAIGALATVAATADARTPRVEGARIIGQNGKPMVVRGVAWGGDRFVPANAETPLAAPDLRTLRKDLSRIRDLGGNLVRVDVASAALGPEQRAGLRRLSALARQRGLTVLLANHAIRDEDQSPYLEELASWFAGQRHVWILVEVEPHCGRLAATAACGDWDAWQDRQIRQIDAVRRGGLRTPVVVETPGGANAIDVERARVLRGRNVIFAVHRSGGGAKTFTPAAARTMRESFGDAAKRLPVIVDLVAPQGLSAEAVRDRPAWLRGYLDWLVVWTLTEGGDGVIGGGIGANGASAMTRKRGSLTRWGRSFGTDYLAMVYRATTGENPRSGLKGAFEMGDRGPGVRTLQRQLQRLGYLSPRMVNGVFGDATWHAVVAFQGWYRMARDGIAGPAVRLKLRTAKRPRSTRASGARVEVDLTRQVLLLIGGNGRTERIVHISSGRTGNTPTGRYSVIRKERMSWSIPFESWMPWASYFVGGFAIHEYGSVPAYPASAGCVRVPAGEAQMIYEFADMGMPVILYRS